jgi:hypothetical protein
MLRVRDGLDLRWLRPIRTEVGRLEASAYVSGMVGTLTAAARPHVFWVGEDLATQERVRAWPVGPALLQMLGDLNSEVGAELMHERARLTRDGYAADLPQPALWWTPSRGARRGSRGGSLRPAIR